MMPFLGGSQREWAELVAALSQTYKCITADLPGFGAAHDFGGYTVSEMADSVIRLLASLDLGPYVLVGHSMAGKISAVVARRLFDNPSLLPPPLGIVLVAPSPPSPEPMTDAKREEMLNMLGTDPLIPMNYSNAEKFVNQNVSHRLPTDLLKRTAEDVLLMHPNAWKAWLTSGSREDWSAFVGVLDIPAVIVAGTHDEALGPDSQRRFTLPHFRSPQLEVLDCSHLIPLEKPAELASYIVRFAQTL